LLSPAASQVEMGEFRFYAALAHAAAWNSASAEERPTYFDALEDHHRHLEIWALHCPANFETKAALVSGEIARIEGRMLEAEHFYELAIRSACENGFAHCEAVANECAAQFYSARGFTKIARVYLRDARDCYLRWGALAKVQQLEERFPQIKAEAEKSSSDTGTIFASVKRLDLATVIRVSEAISGEIEHEKLIDTLMRTAIENAGAERGLLILIRASEPRIEAEATTGPGKIEVVVRQGTVTPSDLPLSALHYVIRTRESVLLDDASADSVYSKDEYVRRKRSKSVLCLPIIKQKKLAGALYLENSLTPRVFTPDRVIILQLLASQAAISLENAALYTDLQLQVGLLQHLPVSAWTLKPDGTPDFVNQVWLEFAGQTADFVRSHPEAWMTAVHPEDRETALRAFWKGVHSGESFAMETRALRAADGTYRWHLNQAVVLRDPDGKVLKFVGTTTDIDDQKRAEEALRQAQAELAHATRVTTMGVLAASIAHEVNQPLSGIITNASTCLRMLAADPPNLAGARDTTLRTIRDGNRASDVIKRLRDLFSKKDPTNESVDLNEATREVIALSRSEIQRSRAILRAVLAEDLPPVAGDRVQLQQVILNLLLNAAQAMIEVNDRPRHMVIKTERHDHDRVRLMVQDTGVGFKIESAEKLFEPFHTTKSGGMGIGLSVSRSIIENHQGRIWATANDGHGATFSFSLPLKRQPADRAEPINQNR
jgi:PAS domain S-box-containing protein